MPRGRLTTQLSQQPPTVTHGIDNLIPALAHLLTRDSSVASARLCDPRAAYIGPLSHSLFSTDAHGFCGYHNLQMQIAFLRQAAPDAPGAAAFLDGVPSLARLQDLIEEAWDAGVNAQGRVQTGGGVRGTRKPIGTLEAQAVLKAAGVATRARAFPSEAVGNAFEELLAFVEGFFVGEEGERVAVTDRPPIYLQRPGHSMTVVGIETDNSGERILLVFDPAIAPSKGIRQLALREGDLVKRPSQMLSPFVCGKRRLQRFTGFETLHLVADGDP